ncbi:alanine--tRNA ligase [Candidatus Uhrbacteria bacterium]|nr:alanine--tRNA ligase [Candidatus Uhrbacteria bacterium]
MITSSEIRKKYVEFFVSKGHIEIPSASLIPENDPTVLFTTAGMHSLVPYLLGEPHPSGNRLTGVQKCIRTGDIDDVGDNRHLTFFEMLGNWSLGDYFKKEAIAWSWEFLTDEKWLGLDPKRIRVTVFAGDADAPQDGEAIKIWSEQFARSGIEAKINERIFPYGKKDNWWGPAGQTGPCGPDTEIYYDIAGYDDPKRHLGDGLREGDCQPSCSCGRYVEIWNNVFMQYGKTADGRFEPLKQRNVDTGMGLERIAMVMQGAKTVFETDLFSPIIEKIEEFSGKSYGNDFPRSSLPNNHTQRAMRIISDHIRAATFIMGDQRGVMPSNVEQGYVVRRLIRRAVQYGKKIGISGGFLGGLAETVIESYSSQYPELEVNSSRILNGLKAEEEKFAQTLERGLKEIGRKYGLYEFLKVEGEISGRDAFYYYESFGFPMEMTEEVTGRKVNREEWDAEMRRHQETSRAGADRKFGSGLADHSERVIRLHTATHLLHQALRQVLGNHVEQKGSNITAERLRFDFSHPEKMTEEQKKRVEDLVNGQIQAGLPVSFRMMDVDEARASGAIGLFADKYAELGNQVKVYTIGRSDDDYFSREICSGPHVKNTAEIGSFRLKKEEASSSGVRRIKAEIG